MAEKRKQREAPKRDTSELAEPTRYPELNVVLGDLVTSSRAILVENFCGAYLNGSFALGDADEYSDVDFLIVTHSDVGEKHLPDLQAMHKRLFALKNTWAQHLDGSYFPKSRLRRLDGSREPLLYLDNGASELSWDTHCDTAVVRWTLREHGVLLDGPPPRSLVDPVPADDLRREARERVSEYTDWAFESANGMSRWQQPYLVLTYCRLLNTLESGSVTTKREAAEWAIKRFDSEWSSLIRRALEDRPDPWLRVHQSAEPTLASQTLAFGELALQEAAKTTG